MLVSIIIPVYNAESNIPALINALNTQDYNDDFEVIFVDDCSKDNSKSILESYIQSEFNFSIKIFQTEINGGPAKARNLGAQHSLGDILVFTDSDCIPKEEWLSSMIEPFKDSIVGGVGGTYETLNPKSLVARYIGYDIEYRHSKFEKYIEFAGTYSAAYRKNLFFEAGMFSDVYKEANAEDNELSYRIIDMGNKIEFAPNAVVKHPHPESMIKMFTQQKSRGVWRVKLYQRNKQHKSDSYTNKFTIIQPFLWILPIAYLIILISFNLFFYSIFQELRMFINVGGFGLLLIIVLLFYIILNFKFLKWINTKKKENMAIVFLIYCMILIRTFSWFIGGIEGFIRFLILKK